MSRITKSTLYFSLLKLSLVFLLVTTPVLVSLAQVVKVDLNFDQRQESEVHSPGYSSWVISSGSSASFEESGVTFKFVADGFTSSWYKAGIQNPYFAQLANDGLVSQDVTLEISGLPAGEHSFLSFHNSFDNPETNTFANIEIFVGETLVHDELVQSNRVLNDADATTAFVTFTLGEGETAMIRFRAEPESGATKKVVYLNGFELNTADAARQPSNPYPLDMDQHANADDGTLNLQWKTAEGALSHNLYVGQDESEVLAASPESSVFIANLTDTTYQIATEGWEPYYWRVDEVYEEDTVKGDIWSFRPRHLAFDEAEGYGRFAMGGRGGQVVHVTNLEDDGPGSLREAVTNSIGPRTIVFDVSGIIELESRLVLKDNYVTIAGQTAPGKGICIKGAPFGMSGAKDCIIQNIRVRLGAGTTYDGMGMQGSDHSIIDHCSISWTIDESFSSRSAKNITLQRTLISEALNVAGHSNYPDGTKHGYAATISGDRGTFHHNLLAHCYGRNWSLGGGLDGNGYYAGELDIRNNVVYNWGHRTTDGGAKEVNFVNNYYKPGASTDFFYAFNAQHENVGMGTQRCYFTGNVMPGHFDENSQEAGRKVSYSNGASETYETYVEDPFFESYVTTQSADEAYKDVLSDVGCISPIFDEHDQRIIRETLEGSYTYKGSRSGLPGMPDHQDDVGGWEDYPDLVRPEDWDSDGDGMPDWWENYNSVNDANADPDANGYTNLEEYLQWIGKPHYFITGDSTLTVDPGMYTRGYQNSPIYEIITVENGNANLSEDGMIVFNGNQEGLAGYSYSVTDAEGSSKTVKINVAVGQFTLSEEIPDEGEEEEEEEATVLEVGAKSTTIAYPNPVSDIISIQSDRVIDSVEVINMQGKKVFSRHGIHTSVVEFDISNLQSGMYFIKIIGPAYEEQMKIVK